MLDPQGEWSWREFAWVDVNHDGQVVASPGGIRAVLFDHGRTIEVTGPNVDWAVAVDLNDHGEVLGIFEGGAFLWSDGEWTDLGATSMQGYPALPKFAVGLALNDRGTVLSAAGQSTEGLPTESFIWRRGVKTPLDFVATAISRHDQVIGNSGVFFSGYPASSRAYSWKKGKRTDLGSLGGGWTFASAINDKGDVAGVSRTAAGEYHVFLWSHGQMIDLGGGTATMRPIVEEVNDHGQIVGYVGLDGFLWDHGSVVQFPRWEPPTCGCINFGPRSAIGLRESDPWICHSALRSYAARTRALGDLRRSRGKDMRLAG